MSTTECPPPADSRSAIQIAWSCLAIIFACTWTAIHPNVPPYHVSRSRWRMLWRRVKMMLWTLLVPELMVCWAVWQWHHVRAIDRKASATFRDTSRTHKDEAVMSQLEAANSKSETSEAKGVRWTTVHSYFLAMGGFAVVSNGSDQRHPLRIHYVAPPWNYTLVIPIPQFQESQSDHYSEAALADHGKGDTVAKTLVIVQLSWFISQLVARAIQGLAITELEIMTLAYAIICGILYGFWFEKPYDVQQPVMVAGPPARHLNEFERFRRLDFLVGTWLFKLHGRIVEDSFFDKFLNVVVVVVGLSRNHDADISGLASIFSAILFGGIHLIAWHFKFPTQVEHILWISSSLCVTVVPIVWILCLVFSKYTHNLSSYVRTRSLFVITPILHNIYFISRLFLIIQPFVLLRDLPASATQAISWSAFFPHI